MMADRAHRSLLTRRRFLERTAWAMTGAAAGWTAKLLAAPNQPTAGQNHFPLIDAHIHVYDPTRPGGVPWPPPSDKLLYRRVLPEDYRAEPKPQPVGGAVVMEASPWLEDNQWVLELAQNEPFILGFVGNLPMGTKEFAGHLKRFSAFPKFRGVRLRDQKLQPLITDAAFLADLRLLAGHDLALDLAGGAEILTFADQLAKTVPRLRIVIDHLAGVVVDGKTPPAAWLGQMKTLAKHRNVYCKLSGLVEGTGHSDGLAPRAVDFYAPVLTTMLELFGPDRLMYASNWPVSGHFAPLAVVQGIVAEFCQRQGQAVTKHLFSSSAKAAYGLA
jgi:L-fuconolactonase